MFTFKLNRIWAVLMLIWAGDACAQDSPRRFEDLSSDPQWEGYRNRLLPEPVPMTRQDFGWRDTAHLEGRRGEVGGWVQRSLTPAWFAKIIPARTLDRVR